MAILGPYRGHWRWPYRGRIVAVSSPYHGCIVDTGRIVAVSWPYRSRIVAVSWPYRGRIVAVSWPYRACIVAVSRPYLMYPFARE